MSCHTLRGGVLFAFAMACWLLQAPGVPACTTAVISGKATTDGRPILWKNRDTSIKRNEVALLTDGDYRAIAVVNAGSRKSIFMGVNEAGFCIENSLSKDLRDDDESPTGMPNGQLMKLALQTCGTVDDFRDLLKTTNETGRSTAANFGVIDATGGAALFETGPTSFTLFDANDPEAAPHGIIVRSNFSTVAQGLPACPLPGEVADIYSAGRYCRAYQLLDRQRRSGIDVPFLLRRMTRDMADADGIPYPGTVAMPQADLPELIPSAGTISRSTTVSAAVFHGARPDESPLSATMWAILGDPKFSVAVPCWASQDEVADPLTDPRGGEIGEVARTLRDWSLAHRADIVSTSGLSDIWSDLWPLEDQMLQTTLRARSDWSSKIFDAETAEQMHQRFAARAMAAMREELVDAKSVILKSAIDAEYDDTARGPWSRPDHVIRVAIYDHTEGTADGPKNLMRFLNEAAGFACQRLAPEQFGPAELSEFDLVILPGGSGSSQSKKLGEAGRQAVRDFIRRGGGYLGICAGSYLASAQYDWSLHLINARVWDRAHWARGNGDVTLRLTEDGNSAFERPELHVGVRYAQGPLLVPGDAADLPPYEALAIYQSEIARKGAPEDAMTGTHAIIRSEFGDGRVVCFSPHPEVENGPNDLIESAIRWAAGSPQSRMKRQEEFRVIDPPRPTPKPESPLRVSHPTAASRPHFARPDRP